MQLWIDVEDLFVHAAGGARRMSGIQRFEAELCRALYDGAARGALPGVAAVRFLRHKATQLSFREIGWAELLALVALLSAETPPAKPVVTAAEPVPDLPPDPPAIPVTPPEPPSWPRRLVRRVPLPLRRPMVAALYRQRDRLRDGVRAARAVAKAMAPPPPAPRLNTPIAAPAMPSVRIELSGFDFEARPDDVVLTAGAAWIFPHYPVRVAALRRRGLRFAALVHDIIPLRRPEWCDPRHSHNFREWLDATLPECDALLTVSRASAREIIRHAEQSDVFLPHDPVVVPMGSGFRRLPRLAAADLRRLPAPGSYALFVSTLEPRKNQAYLIQVWRQLLAELPRERVPTLVLAGHVGGMVGDLMQELRNSAYFAGAVRVVSDASDAELAALYDGCRFTLFPSLYEGWGLPVTESLAFGKPCLASDTTSIPEAGGHLARYFDPLNVRSGVLAVRSLIEHPENLTAWQAQITREHRPTPWAETAQAVIAALNCVGNNPQYSVSVRNCDELATK